MKPPKGVWLLIPLLASALLVAATTVDLDELLLDDNESAAYEQFKELEQASEPRASDEHNGRHNAPGSGAQIKSYERVVLEGAQIIISCPYPPPSASSAWQLAPTSSFAGTKFELNNRVSVEQKQFAFVDNNSSSKLSDAKRLAHSDSTKQKQERERVKWFRNHVPLVNLNYFQQSSFDSSGDKESAELLPDVAESLSKPKSSQAEGDLEESDSGSVLPSPSAGAPNVNELAKKEEEDRDRKLRAGDLDGGDREKASISQAEWHINELGELVINRATQYFAGKYTCLAAGRRSELLLDVLPDGGKDSSAGATRVQHDPRWFASPSSSLESGPPATQRSVYRYGQEQKPGNGPIGEFQEKSFELEATAGSPLDQSHSPDANRSPERGLARADAEAKRAKGEPKRADSIKTPLGDTGGAGSSERLAISLPEMPADAINGPQMKPGSFIDDIDDSATSSSTPETEAGELPAGESSKPPRRLQAKTAPIHLAKSELIQMNDLKSVAGFLYTKQRLYCPIGSLELVEWQRFALIEALCSSPTPIQALNGTRKSLLKHRSTFGKLEDRCRRLAGRLIWSQTDGHSGPGTGNCTRQLSSNIARVQLVWFKDGKRLEFDANGRSAGQTNVRLSDSESEFKDGEDGEEKQPIAQLDSTARCRLALVGGRSLEIEGPRRENGGQYSCWIELKLNPASILPVRVRQQRQPAAKLSFGHDNDVSCCDRPKAGAKVDELNERQSGVGIETNSQSFGDAGPEVGQARLKLLRQRVVLLESILAEASANAGKNYIAHLLSTIARPQQEQQPRNIQTFSVSVSERPANLSELWSTLLEAGDAYARRKLADFRRLKRSSASSMANQQAVGASWPTSGRQESHMNNGDRKFTPNAFVNTNDASGKLRVVPNDIDDNLKRPLTDGGHLADDKDDDNDNNDDESNNNNGSKLLNNADASNSDELVGSNIGRRVGKTKPHIQTRIQTQTQTSTAPGWSREAELFNYVNERNSRPPTAGTGSEASNAKLHAPDKPSDRMLSDDHLRAQKTREDLITQKGYHAIHLAPLVVADLEPAREEEEGWSPEDEELEERRPSELAGSVINDLAPVIDGRLAGGKRKAATSRVIGGDSEVEHVVAADDGGKQASAGDRHGHRRTRKYKSDQWDGKWRDWSKSFGAAKSQQDKLGPFGATRYRRSWSDGGGGSGQWLNSQLTGSDATRSSGPSETTKRPSTKEGEEVEQIDQSSGQRRLLVPSDGANQAAEPVASSSILGLESSLKETTVLLPYDSASIDESLMWTAGQYLYMHMKALASSPIFGVEVAVEWSNERTNGSGLGAGDLELDKDNYFSKQDGRPTTPSSAYVRARDGGSPFATIDVLAGQNLQLQCTAQALGRLPEVKWYKRIGALPARLKSLVGLVRRIGRDLYWPLTELDLLRAAAQEEDNDDDAGTRRSFVCSQTTTIFDNLAKQTFTVVNSLQLSQYNDAATSSQQTVRSHPPVGAGANLNLYACIVDADVRHNYATLGVHLRQPPSKFPYEISKRLQARSTFSIKQPNIMSPHHESNHPAEATKKDFADGSARFDFFRENHLKFPLKSYWVPIQNGSSAGDNSNSDILLLTPSILSALILFVLTSFVALLYLTVRTYRSLTLPMADEDCDDAGAPTVMSTRMELLAAGKNQPSTTEEAANCIIASGQCLCHLELDEDQPVIDIERSLYVDLDETTTTTTKSSQSLGVDNMNTERVLYDAHVHHGYSCRQFSLPIEIIPSFSHNKLSYLDSLSKSHDKRQQLQSLEDCCQQPSELSSVRICLFENPFHE